MIIDYSAKTAIDLEEWESAGVEYQDDFLQDLADNIENPVTMDRTTASESCE